jgi:hypothetical protein
MRYHIIYNTVLIVAILRDRFGLEEDHRNLLHAPKLCGLGQ